jgi:hypothetical protein
MEAWSLHNRLRDQIDTARKGEGALMDRCMSQLSVTEKVLFQFPGLLLPKLECGYYPLVAATNTRLRPHELTTVSLGLHLDAQLNQWHFERTLEARTFRPSRVVSPKEESDEYTLRDIQVEMTSLQRTSVAVFNNTEHEVIIKHASIIGVEFDVRALTAIVPKKLQSMVLQSLDIFQEMGLVHCIGEDLVPIFSFQNSLIRNAVYDLLSIR